MTNIIKQAEFMEGFISTIKDKTHFMNKPLETIFGIFGTMYLWRRSKLLGMFGFLAEALGYGPGWIGKQIDDHLRSTKKNGQVDLTDENLKSAAEVSVNNVLAQSGKEATMTVDIYKTAGLVSSLFGTSQNYKNSSFLTKVLGGRRTGLTNILFSFLKTIAGGILGLGIVGGLMSSTGVGKSGPTSVAPKAQGNFQYYSNVAKNVEDTLIVFLDAAVSGFSKGFQQTTGQALKGSSRMQKILKEIVQMNWVKSIEEVNQSGSFVGPSVVLLAKQLLPEGQYEPIGAVVKPIETPKFIRPSKIDAPVSKLQPGEELKQLLKGVY